MSDLRLKVDLIMAQTELLKLKADDYNWQVHVPDETKLVVEQTLAEIKKALNQSDKKESKDNG